MLNKEEFVNKLITDIKGYLPENFSDAEVTIEEFKKLNSTIQGLIVRDKKSNTGAVLDIDKLFEMYCDGIEIDEILSYAAKIIKSTVKTNIDFNIDNYEEVKERLFLRLINKERNKEFLENIVHREVMEDLALVYYVLVEETERGIASAAISNDIFNSYGVSLDTLHNDAIDNASRIFPENIVNNNGLIYLSNDARRNGSSAILYNEVARNISNEYFSGKGFYIIPSSVHELFLCDESKDSNSLKDLLMRTNRDPRTMREPDMLSDNIYHYNPDDGEIKIVC